MDNKLFGQRLSAILLEKNLSAKELAQMVDLSTSAIGTILSGKRKPSIDVFWRIVQVLDIAPESLLRDNCRKADEYCLIELLNQKYPNLSAKQKNFVEKLCILVAKEW